MSCGIWLWVLPSVGYILVTAWFNLWLHSGPIAVHSATRPLCGPAHCVLVVCSSRSSGFDSSAVVCPAIATCMLRFRTLNAMWSFLMVLFPPVLSSSDAMGMQCFYLSPVPYVDVKYLQLICGEKKTSFCYLSVNPSTLILCETDRRQADLNMFTSL